MAEACLNIVSRHCKVTPATLRRLKIVVLLLGQLKTRSSLSLRSFLFQTLQCPHISDTIIVILLTYLLREERPG